MRKTMMANRAERENTRRVNLLAEDGYNLLKLTIEVGALQ